MLPVVLPATPKPLPPASVAAGEAGRLPLPVRMLAGAAAVRMVPAARRVAGALRGLKGLLKAAEEVAAAVLAAWEASEAAFGAGLKPAPRPVGTDLPALAAACCWTCAHAAVH
jgi:hypothetical protein